MSDILLMKRTKNVLLQALHGDAIAKDWQPALFGEVARIEEYLAQSLVDNPSQQAVTLISAASCYLKANEGEKAEEMIEKAIEANPKLLPEANRIVYELKEKQNG